MSTAFKINAFRPECSMEIIICFVIFCCSCVAKGDEMENYHTVQTSRHLLQEINVSVVPSCMPSGINSFPPDFFTQRQRQHGGVIVHFVIAIYVCLMIGIVCDDYFVPSLDIISQRLKLPPDIAGATFMAIGTSAPELFSSITGSFITKGDIGVGTIIGSAVFNMVGVTGLVGIIIWDKVLDIDWYPIARDCTAYGITVLTLIWIIADNLVTWYEALVLIIIFILYILIIYFNSAIEKGTRRLVRSIHNSCSTGESTPLIADAFAYTEIAESRKSFMVEHDSYSVEITASKQNEVLQENSAKLKMVDKEQVTTHRISSPCDWPQYSGWKLLHWLIMYPARLIFFITIPNSNNIKLRRIFPLTFIMSVIWIGILSYMAAWMVTVIGFTFSIPDSVIGLTILAAGTSVPEVISSIIVARNGKGNMSISNLVGSNTFDISFCLGGPWLIKTLLSSPKSLVIYSSAMTYTTVTLLVTLVLFVLTFQLSGWKFNRTVGAVFVFIYIVFVVLACMYELNVFGKINLPPCK